MRIYLNMGALSDENGAYAPGRVFVELAKELGTTPEYGSHWGQDSLEISERDWPVAKQRLEEARMVYRVEGIHVQWQNVLAADARRAAGAPAAVAMFM